MDRELSRREARRITPSEAAYRVKSGDWIDYGAALAQPDLFDRALAARKDELTDIKIRSCLSTVPRAVLEVDPERKHFHWYSWHFSGYDRKHHDAGRCHYIPCNLGEIPDYYRRFIEPPDVVVLKVCEVDAHGFFNLSLANLWHKAVVARAKIVIVEVSQGLPYVCGPENGIHISDVDYVIDGGSAAPPQIANPPPSDTDRAVARLIAAEIDNGACLQIGIGAMPNAVCSLLLESGVRELGLHTEMLTDGIIDLYKAGLITGTHKTTDPKKIVCSFGFGSDVLYRAVHNNPDFVCAPVDYTNVPNRIMQNKGVVAINNTTQLDLQGQASSESAGHRHISGTGGQLQFVRGAYASEDGKAFICLSSTYERHGVRQSRIVLELTPGNIVTTPRSDVMYVVTEFGMVNLKGKSVPERAIALIGLAHPDFREGLEREAYTHGLIPRGARGAL